MATSNTVKNTSAAFASFPYADEAKAADSVMRLQKTAGAGVRTPSALQLTLLTGGSGCGKSTLARAMLDDIRALARRCRMLIVITNEIGCEGNIGGKVGTEALYCTALSLANNALAREADRVLEVVCGIPLPLTRCNP